MASNRFTKLNISHMLVFRHLKRHCSFEFPRETRVVIAGAGLIANSVAYHLSEHGLNDDVVVFEQNGIASGSSGLSSGSIGLLKPPAMRSIITQSIGLYERLQQLGFDVRYEKTGCLYLARTIDRMIALKRRMAYSKPTGLDCTYMSSNEIRKSHPEMWSEGLVGGVWVPDDAIANPNAICNALAELAKRNGVQYVENCAVQKVNTKDGQICGVETEKGYVECETFVNCAGIWARELGLKCNPQVRIPVYPAKHFFIEADLPPNSNLPCLKDYDSHMYLRKHDNKVTVGWFEKEAKPAFGNLKVPRDWRKHLGEDFEHLNALWENAQSYVPALKDVTDVKFSNTVGNFTPDGRWIMGETPEVKNSYVACGMNGNSLQSGGGIGKAIAEWIIEGSPTFDVLPFDISRFLDLHNNRQYLYERTKEIVGRQYSILYPHQSEYKYARKLRCSPLYSILEKRGAVFGIKMGYERALYFDTSKTGVRKMPHGSFFKPNFFEFMQKEYLACREAVGIIDMSSFSKIEIWSSDDSVISYLQHLCSNNVDVPIGRIIHTGMQNHKGGFENDCILLRLDKYKYFMVSPTTQQTKIFNWMTQNLPGDHSVQLNDVTSMYTVINVVGPKACDLMNELSGSVLSLPSFMYTRLDIGYISDVMVMGFTHTGEPGYCLYVPSEYALHVYDQLMTIGKDYGARDVGILTQRSMRIERFIPFWGEELSTAVTPYEAGNGYRVKLDKSDFIGREALRIQKERGVTKKLVMFDLDNFDADCEIWPWGGEPIYRNDRFVGAVTSTGYGFTKNKLVCLGFIAKPGSKEIIEDDYIMAKDALYQIDIAGNRFEMKPNLHPPYFATKSYPKKRNPISLKQ